MGILAAQTACPARHSQGAVMLYAIQVDDRTVEYALEVCCAEGGQMLHRGIERP